jgi:DNA repair protein RecO (recombination protein O)
MKTNHKSKAILLRSLDYGESDRIVTFFTDEYGKIKGIAKGARRSKRRFANALESFSSALIVFSRKRNEGLALIEACDVAEYYPRIRMDLNKMLMAAYFIELVDQFTLEGKKHEEIFDLLTECLDLLERDTLSESFARIFEIRLLKLLGYEPLMEHCVGCKIPLEQIKQLSFDPTSGGIRCMHCAADMRKTYPMSVGTVKLLLLAKNMEIGKIPQLIFSERDREESRKAIASFICHLLGKEPKSLSVLNEIRRMSF